MSTPIHFDAGIYRRRKIKSTVGLFLSMSAMAVGLVFLLWILSILMFKGFSSLNIMLSAPSIVVGLFIYAIVVVNAKHFSGWAGTLALALIAIPVVVRNTENMLRLVPVTLREAAFALGAPKWKVSTTVVLKAARSGVMTGLLLSLARVSGETAPLLFTALNNQFYSTNMNAPMANLPVVIYQFAMSPYENWVNLAWGAALLITLTVLGLNIVARAVFKEKVAV